ncbi:unnamed protein product, partial [Staurois parvus]
LAYIWPLRHYSCHFHQPYPSTNNNNGVLLLLLNPTMGHQGQTDHWGTRALPEGPGSVGGPMRCFFGCGLSVGEDTGTP